MTAHEAVLYGSFAGHVELREDIVRRADVAMRRAASLRNIIGIVAILIGLLQLVKLFAPVPWLDWSSNHSAAIRFFLGGSWLLAAVNVWCCRQRFDDSRANLLAYVNHLPIR
jgi:hypothetical protein